MKITGVQICPFGTWRNGTLIQVCDQKAFESIVRKFDKDVLVDFEHWGEDETKGDTRAAAWIKAVRIDPKDGLVGDFELTPKGDEAVLTKELRYLSPVWYLDASNRPVSLLSVGLTNRPAIPVRPVKNKISDAPEPAAIPGASILTLPQQEIQMKTVLELLGLPETATEADACAAIKKIQEAAQTAESAKLMSEAQNVCKTKNVAETNRQAFCDKYVANKGMLTMDMVEMFAPTPAKVVNKDAAQTPKTEDAGEAASDAVILNKYNAMSRGAAKNKFLDEHCEAIARARNAQKGE